MIQKQFNPIQCAVRLYALIAIPRSSQARLVGAKEPGMKIINNKEPISVSNESTMIFVSCHRSWERNKLYYNYSEHTDEIPFLLQERKIEILDFLLCRNV